MRTKTKYEWDREAIQKHPCGEVDIIEHIHAEKLKAVWSHEAALTIDAANDSRLVLIRDMFASDGDLIDRQWAYVSDGEAGRGKLPEVFDAGAKVPKRFHQELVKSWKKEKRGGAGRILLF